MMVDETIILPQVKRVSYLREKALVNLMTSDATPEILGANSANDDGGSSRYFIDLPFSFSTDEDWLLARDEFAAVPGNDPGIVEARGKIAAELRRRGLE